MAVSASTVITPAVFILLFPDAAEVESNVVMIFD
jgi:hypothetical protein